MSDVVCLSASAKNNNWETIISEGVWGVVKNNPAREHIQVGTLVLIFRGPDLLAFGEVYRVLDNPSAEECDKRWVRHEWKSSSGSGHNLLCAKMFWMRNVTMVCWTKKQIMTRLGHPNCNLQCGLHVVDEAFAAELRDILRCVARASARASAGAIDIV